jgi:RNase P subunit RPR2
MTDETKQRRRTQANAIRVLASPARLPMEEFKRHYQKRHVIIDEKARDAIEQSTQEMFCDECIEPMPHGGMSAHILHVAIDNDPLGNFWKLATLRCYGCGFEEHVPLDKPIFEPKDFNDIGEMGMTPLAPGMIHTVNPPMIGTPIPGQYVDTRNPWKEEYRAQHQVYARNHAIAQQAAMANQKAAYGMSALQQQMNSSAEALKEMRHMKLMMDDLEDLKHDEMVEKIRQRGATCPPPPPDPHEQKLIERIRKQMGF